jgi:hypothetical protein
VALDAEQREFFDDLDDFSEQAITSTQYAGFVLSHLRRWQAEGRPVSGDTLIEWARQRELEDWQGGLLAGLALAVQHDDDPAAQG